jgi:hypothetical protein
MDSKVYCFALICPPEMAMLLVEEFLCKSLVKACIESTFSSSNVILLGNSSTMVFTCWNLKFSNLTSTALSQAEMKFIIYSIKPNV